MEYILTKYLFFILFVRKITMKNKIFVHKCIIDELEDTPIISQHNIPINTNNSLYKRRLQELDNEGFKNLNIFVDLYNVEEEIKINEITEFHDYIINGLKTAAESLCTLLKVKPHNIDDWMSDQQLKNAKINYWDKTKFGDEAYKNGMTFFSTGIDIAIFARIGDLDEIGYSTLASSTVFYQEGSNGMPFAGKLNINKDNLTLKDGLQQYIN